MDTILDIRGLRKTFGSVVALNKVNVQVTRAHIHFIVGENGAGKSTMMKVISGVYPHGSYEGEVLYNGQKCAFNTIKDSEKAGIVIIHQELALIPYMTIGENMFLGNERGHKYKINWNETNARASELLKTVGLKEGALLCSSSSPHRTVKPYPRYRCTLPVASRRATRPQAATARRTGS